MSFPCVISSHHKNKKSFYCSTCSEFCCEKCIKANKHDGHNFTGDKDNFRSLAIEAKKKRTRELMEMKSRLNIEQEEMMERVSYEFNMLREKLDQREMELKREIERKFSVQNKLIDRSMNVIEDLELEKVSNETLVKNHERIQLEQVNSLQLDGLTKSFELMSSMLEESGKVSECQKIKVHSFSEQFIPLERGIGQYHIRGNTNLLLDNPLDVKISYQLNCIIVSDNQRIPIYDLDTKEYICELKGMNRSRYLFVEENFDGQNNDALIFSCDDHSVYKLDLLACVKRAKKNQTATVLWKSTGYAYPSGVVVRYTEGKKSTNGRQVFVCDSDNNAIKILSSLNGELLYRISLQCTIVNPWCIDFTNNDEMVITERNNTHRVQILSQMDNGNWVCVRTFGKEGGTPNEFKHPRGMVIDKQSQHVIVADCDNHKVKVFTLQGELLKEVGKNAIASSNKTDFTCPWSVCINELSGELLVVDTSNHRIVFFA